MASMYLAQKLGKASTGKKEKEEVGDFKAHEDDLSVAPRAFQLDDLPSTPQLNSIMDR